MKVNKKLLLALSVTTVSFVPLTSSANPEGGSVASGDINISQSGSNLNINQSTDKGIIDWRSFDIQTGEATNFYQPGSSSVTLNRIHDIKPSQINGSLTANGKVILVNNQGIVFGDNSVVNVGGIVATSNNISNEDFNLGNYNFNGGSVAGAQIINKGNITASEAGIAALVAPEVRNEGVINAKLGKVVLGSGEKYTLDLNGDGLIKFETDSSLQQHIIDNSGSITADGGTIQISAATAVDQIDNLISSSGSIQSNRVDNVNGKIIISSDYSNQSGRDIASLSGNVSAQSGNIELKSRSLDNTGTIDVSSYNSSLNAGNVNVTSDYITNQGNIKADGSAGKGGQVNLQFKNSYIDNYSSQTSANGGGAINLNGDIGSQIFASGKYYAKSNNGGTGGKIHVQADKINLYATEIDASGDYGGGEILIGGGAHGNGEIRNATETNVNYYTNVKANATVDGNGGEIVIWSDQQTRFSGNIEAKGFGIGNGGFAEVSSSNDLAFGGTADVSSLLGQAGTFLLDPKNITISNSGDPSFPYAYFQELIDPNAASANKFGDSILTLSNGNVVVTSPFDDTNATDSGAVYLFNTGNGALVDTIRGSTANDYIGSSGLVDIGNGNFLIQSPNWTNVSATDAGAVTWGSGSSGWSGATISSSNSLVGSATNDLVGDTNSITILSNGNYVVNSYLWNNGSTVDVGAVTWGNGSSGTSGAVSTSNSLYGSTANDEVGSNGIIALSNGNYIIQSNLWDNSTATDAGAVTWINGSNGRALDWTSGAVGEAVSSSNSLVGSTANDNVGGIDIVEVSNGSFVNYVVISKDWDNGSTTDVGAVTWASGTSGRAGAVSSSNSLIGSTANDKVGENGISVLTNGNYVVISPDWDNGSTANVGAVTWINGANGQDTLGVSNTTISSSNSLIGVQADDQVGINGVTPLTNGNYVVASPYFDGSSITDIGAVTWGNGTTGGTVGQVSSSNSLVGSLSGDEVGSGGIYTGSSSNLGTILALPNGNFVVSSPNWDLNGSISDSGAVTWGNGSTGKYGPGAGVYGTISSSNSLVGSTDDDGVGSSITVVGGNNYVVVTPTWNNGATSNVGAITWINGSTGSTVGSISSSNSLIGSTANDQIGFGGVTTLTGSGNYVVSSPFWDNGGTVNVGAATWANGSTGLTGTVSSSNSLIGSTAGDLVSRDGIYSLDNGNYLVFSSFWDNGSNTNAGAATWVSGSNGHTMDWTSGSIGKTVSSANSIVGSSSNDKVGQLGYAPVGTDNALLFVPLWDNGTTADVGAVTWINGLTGTAGVISASNSMIGSTAGDQVGNLGAYVLSNGNYIIVSGLWDNGSIIDGGALTWGNGSTGTFGVVSSINSIVGNNASSFTFDVQEIGTSGNYVTKVDSNNSNAGQVYVSNGTNPSLNVTYSFLASNSLTINPLYLTNILSNGSNLLLQANNDITISNNIIVNNISGNGGNLTLEAGRDLIINANITTDNGNLTLLANSPAANGVIDAYRDPGAADVTMNSGTTINAGTGTVAITLSNGAGNTNNTAGNIALKTISANTMSVVNSNNSSTTDFGSTTATNLYITAIGTVTQSQAINATNLLLSGTGGTYTLTNSSNAITTLAANTGTVNFTENSGFAIGTVNSVNGVTATNLYLSSTATVTQSQAINATNLLLSGSGGIYTLTNTSNSIGTIAANTGIVNYDNGSTNLAVGSVNSVNGITSTGTTTLKTTGTLTLNNAITSSSTGTAITLKSNVLNNSFGANALVASNGRWLSYSVNPTSDTGEELLSSAFRLWSCTYGGSCPSIPGTGNGLLYSFTPTITITPNSASITYGSAANLSSYTISGYLGNDSSADSRTGSVTLTAQGYSIGSNVGTYNINSSGNLASSIGYAVSYANLTNGLTVDKKTITAVVHDQVIGFGDPTPTLDKNSTVYVTYSGLISGDNNSAIDSVTFDYGGALPGCCDSSGYYALTISAFSDNNYSLNIPSGVISGTLTITGNGIADPRIPKTLPSIVDYANSFPASNENAESLSENIIDYQNSGTVNNISVNLEPNVSNIFDVTIKELCLSYKYCSKKVVSKNTLKDVSEAGSGEIMTN